ncbi:hypothetical protein FIU83_00330 [Halomonas sp. THAF5a]|uniref:hypothetical protein n=1 Tax=Halomonas sp. THAF5a TaxID=2587844 RepID=UPI001268183F|nr:hypothetical protein [Halomonas sp. THAF5a]QFU00084.1 hypothetical protein FIU83_00330 [Halomonas sp. THAF5a]
MSAVDQAAGLRQWAGSQRAPDAPRTHAAPAGAPPRTLVVVGLPGTTPDQARRVTALLEHWAAQGQRWVSDPARWRVVPLAVTSPHLPALLDQQPRWALWIGSDPDAFRRAFAVLRRLHARQGPRRLLAVHAPELPRRGLLNNLRQAAWQCLGIDLLVMAP